MQYTTEDLNEISDEGFTAYMLGFNLQDNPYGVGSDRYKAWNNGWFESEGHDSNDPYYGNGL